MKALYRVPATILLVGVFLFQVSATLAAEESVVAKVGDRRITREALDHIIATIPEQNRIPFLTPDGRKKILDEVIAFTLFAEAAKKEGMDKEPAIKTRLDYTQTEYLAREYFRKRQAKEPSISEEEMKAYFNSHKAEFKPREEIKARHILVKTEADAKKALEKLKAGEDFAALAKKVSIDPAKDIGGALQLPDGRDWLPRDSFEASFEHVLFNIPKGQVGGPIKTQFGWHVLKVDDKRQPEMPSYVQVRANIKRRLEYERNNELHKQLTDELKGKIPVEIK
ncbi:MAG: peptidyl-prolyl cis-trans isomerase [Thermodesulfobacteriota bacterium]